MARPGNGSNIGDKVGKPGNAANIGDKVGKPGNLKPSDKMAKPNLDRPVGKPKPGLDQDVRPKTPSPLGEVTRGRDAKAQSNRGNKAMGGGASRPNFNPRWAVAAVAAARNSYPSTTWAGAVAVRRRRPWSPALTAQQERTGS